ncbi:MAG: hypothetical protein NTW19_14055 [Planctomycetota bacterium]|nr:hypothetical protein [Planctomycetota bacterium]
MAIALMLTSCGKAPSDSKILEQDPQTLKAGIESKHPATYYILARKLMSAGEKDDAVFWYYAGQLRYRYHLAANPKLEPSGDPALFGALSEDVGRPINEYAFGDIPKLAATIDKVLAWDDSNANGFTAKTLAPEQLEKVREGLSKLKTKILAEKDEIMRKRKEAGH